MRDCDLCGAPSVDACILCMHPDRLPDAPITRCQDCLHLGHDRDPRMPHEFKSYNAWGAGQAARSRRQDPASAS